MLSSVIAGIARDAGSLVEECASWEPDSLAEPSYLQCWQRSNSYNSAGPQVNTCMSPVTRPNTCMHIQVADKLSRNMCVADNALL